MRVFLTAAAILLSFSFAFGQTPGACEQAFKAKLYANAADKCSAEIKQAPVTMAKDKLFVLYFARGYSNMFAPRVYGKGEKEVVYAQSAADFEQCNKLVPNQAMVYYLLGFAQRIALPWKEQITTAKNFSEAIRLGSKQTDIYFLRGEAYEHYYFSATEAEKLKGYELAIADYTKDIELRPKDMTSIMRRKGLYMETGKYKEAIDDLSVIIDFLPNEIDYPIERGQAYAKWKKYPEAIKEFTGLLEDIEDSNGDEDEKAEYNKKVLGLRAEVYQQMGNKAEWCKDKKAIDDGFDCNKNWKK